MAKVGAQRAAVLTGRSKSTIQRAMNSGKLSFEQDANGRRIVDVSEIERVFGIKSTKPQAPAQQNVTASAPAAKTVTTYAAPNMDEIADAVERERMAMTIKMLEMQLSAATDHLEDLKSQRDKWERQATQVLLTSQYSQKQAEELRAQIKEREERIKIRRLQYEERFAQIQGDDKRSPLLGNAPRPAQAHEQKSPQSSPKPQVTNKSREAEKLDEQMKKLKAENQNAQKTSNSVFRFWKKVSG